MKHRLFLGLVCAAIIFPVAAAAQGITVFYQSPTEMVQLMPLMPSGGGIAKAGKMFVPGLTPQIVRTYDGEESPVKVMEAKPMLLLREPKVLATYPGFTARDVKIVRLRSRKGRRELQITRGGNMFTFKAGTDENQLVPIDVGQTEDGFSIVSKIDLPPGEYMVVMGNNPTGYDFSIRR